MYRASQLCEASGGSRSPRAAADAGTDALWRFEAMMGECVTDVAGFVSLNWRSICLSQLLDAGRCCHRSLTQLADPQLQHLILSSQRLRFGLVVRALVPRGASAKREVVAFAMNAVSTARHWAHRW